MNANRANRRTLEIILVLTTAVLTCVLHQTAGYKIIVLNLFYLPVILAAFYLGRYRAGVLAFFGVLAASVVTAIDLDDFAAYSSPLVIGLSIIVWGSVLGLAALLVGTLSDDLSSRMTELHESYVGVVEVLSCYLQGAQPNLKARSQRIAELCHEVAAQMKLSVRETDDIRVAALLCDMENIEITSRVIRKAIGDLEPEQKGAGQHTFQGTELVQSLGPVLLGAFPLVLNQSEPCQCHSDLGSPSSGSVPLGAQIIRVVRAYDAQLHGKWSLPGATPADALEELRRDADAGHPPAILSALERVVLKAGSSEKAAPAAAPAAAPDEELKTAGALSPR